MEGEALADGGSVARCGAADRMVSQWAGSFSRLCRARWAGPLAVLAIVAGVLATAAYILRYGVDVPFWDEWLVVDALRKRSAGQYGWTELWGQHNEHRLVVPMLLFWAEYSLLGDHSPKFCMYLCLAMLCGVLGVFASEFRRLLPGLSRTCRLFLFAPLVWVMLSPRQFENLLWGFQIAFVGVATFAVLSVWMLERFRRQEGLSGQALYLGLAAVLAACASFSAAMGLIVWWVGVPLVAIARKRRAWWSLVWVMLAIGVWWVYFRGYAKPATHPELALFWDRPFHFLYFFLSTVGSVGAPIPPLAAVGGAVLCGYAATRVFRLVWRRDREGLFWLTVVLFGFGTALSVSVGRSGFGIQQSLSSRYVTFSLLSAVGCMALLLQDAATAWSRRRVRTTALAMGVALSILGASILTGAIWGIHGGRMMRARNMEALAILSHLESATDAELAKVYPAPDYCRLNAEFAKARGLTPFAKTRR